MAARGLVARMKSLMKSVEPEGSGTDDAVMSTIPADTVRSVPSGYQQAVFGSLVISGTMSVAGTLKVCAWPS